MSNIKRKSSVIKKGKQSRVSPYSTESDTAGEFLENDGSFLEDLHDEDEAPIVTATVVQARSSFKKTPSVQKLANKSLSRPMKASFRDKASTLQYEPDFEDTLPPPINPWPEALRQKISQKLSKKPNIAAGREFLSRQNWPNGLQEAVFKSCKKIPLRFYIVDDSGSMISGDGRRVISQGNQFRLIKCTRWAELSNSILFLAELSQALEVISEFRLVNGADPVIIGVDQEGPEGSLAFLKEVMAESPAGPTPLCAHIQAIVTNIESIAELLKERNQRAVVVIATDGESTDGDVAQALKPLINLPVIVIVRLCTEEQNIIDYWDNIDQQLELDIDVIDDQLGDAKQVSKVNGWLTYGEAIHRVREFGASMKELDIIDENTISMEQMQVICSYIFCNGDADALPHPNMNWNLFASAIKDHVKKQGKVYCPISQAMKPWVDINVLYKVYAKEIRQNQPSSCTLC